MSQTNTDLMQVSALFKDCIAMVRSRPTESLDRAAEEWLKEARLRIMKQIEEGYYELSQAANDTLPSRVPSWAIDPTLPLQIYTPTHTRALGQYCEAFQAEFSKLMVECGFKAEVSAISSSGNHFYCINIFFPAGVPSQQPPQITKTFDSLPKFSATTLRITQVDAEPTVTWPDEDISREEGDEAS